MKLDLSRPDITYGLIWGATMAMMALLPAGFVVEFPSVLFVLIVFNIGSFFAIYATVNWLVAPKAGLATMTLSNVDVGCLSRFSWICFVAWLVSYLINIYFSGGLPIVWAIGGDTRTYVDFGLPTVTGLLNMIRAFVFAAGILLYLQQPEQKRHLILPCILLGTTILELSRGTMSVMLLHGVAMYVLQKKNFSKLIFVLVPAFLLFVILFGVVADIRGAHPDIEGLVGDQEIFLQLPTGFFWVYSYMVSPLNNLSFAVSQGIESLYYPYFSLQGLLPTVIRDLFFEEMSYPVALANEAFNATSYYSPLIVDFGLAGALLVILILQGVVSYTHIKAKSGNVFFLLIYPAFFMCVVLSIFYMYFFSLVTILYPLLAMLYIDYRRYYRRRFLLPSPNSI